MADLPHVVASFAILVKRLAALALFAGLAGGAWAQSVALQGMLGSRALLLIDGGAPRSLAVGDSAQGVKLVSVGADSAVVEMRSSASVAIDTAVSNPKVMSVPGMSLSIVFGTPTTGSPSCCSASAVLSVPSPPITIRASMPFASTVRRMLA